MAAGLSGDRCGERRGEAGEDLLLMGEQRRAVDDRAGDRAEPIARIRLSQYALPVEDEATERGQNRHSGLSLSHGVDHRLLELQEAVVEELGLAGEVVVDRLRVDVGRSGDLGDGDRVEAALEEELARGVGDQLPRALLLALAEAMLVGVGGHAPFVVRSGFAARELTSPAPRSRLRRRRGLLSGITSIQGKILVKGTFHRSMGRRTAAPTGWPRPSGR